MLICYVSNSFRTAKKSEWMKYTQAEFHWELLLLFPDVTQWKNWRHSMEWRSHVVFLALILRGVLSFHVESLTLWLTDRWKKCALLPWNRCTRKPDYCESTCVLCLRAVSWHGRLVESHAICIVSFEIRMICFPCYVMIILLWCWLSETKRLPLITELNTTLYFRWKHPRSCPESARDHRWEKPSQKRSSHSENGKRFLKNLKYYQNR